MSTDLATRIAAATPVGRDRAIDALRGIAILGVVLGHWLVTALVVDSGSLRAASPLRYLPELSPVSWAFQTLAVFFLVGGWAAGRGWPPGRRGATGHGWAPGRERATDHGRAPGRERATGHGWAPGRERATDHGRADGRYADYWSWLRTRLARLFRPVTVVLMVWAAVAVVLLAYGVDPQTVRTPVKLVLSPLWFLLVFAVLTATTPIAARLRPAWLVATVALVDLGRLALDGPAWLGWANVAAGWLVPYCLGVRWARHGTPDRATAWALLLGGAAATAALVRWAGYPASMVGVPGAGFSNLDPPSLAAVTFGVAQCGAAVLLLGPLRRLLRRPRPWAAVVLVNRSAMTIFLWHQTALIAVTSLGLLAGQPLPGLHTPPDSAGWVLARIAWLPAFAVALLACWTAFHARERPMIQASLKSL